MSMNSFHSRDRRRPPQPAKAPPTPQRTEGLERADVLMVAQGLADSRSRAREAIAAGRVSVDGRPVSRAGQTLPTGAKLSLQPDTED